MASREQAKKNREEAKRLGEKAFEGTPCRKFSHTTRWVSDGKCIECSREGLRKLQESRKTEEQIERRENRKKARENREKAKANNERFYFGVPCKKCSHTKRYTKGTNACINCAEIRAERDKSQETRDRLEAKKQRRKRREEAKKLGYKSYRGAPCRKYGHTIRRTSDGVCIECERIQYANSEFAKRGKIIKNNNIKKEEARKRGEKRFRGMPCAKGHTERYVNSGSCVECGYERVVARRKKNRKEEAIPYWSNTEEIAEIYWFCRQLSKETRKEFHVDHIVPLQGENVSGLHVPCNLRIITAQENFSKHNKLIEEGLLDRLYPNYFIEEQA